MNKRKFFIGVLGLVLLFFAYHVFSGLYYDWKERTVLKVYKQNPQLKIFTDMIEFNKKDLASNPTLEKKITASLSMGLHWYNLQEFGLAVRWWRKGLDLAPKHVIGWYNLGNAYLVLKDYSNAERAYRKSMKFAGEGEIDACLALGELYEHAYKEKQDQEDDVYLECLKKHKDNRDLLARLASYYRDFGDKQNALKYFDKLFSFEPTAEVAEEIRNLQRSTE